VADRYDVAIVGGGILGLATARAITERRPDARLVILEKESKLATHQTGHNSGVIHSGLYYKPGSYKARLCVEGARLMEAFCDEHGVRRQTIGKVVVATEPEELPRLDTLYQRGVANGVPGVRMLEPGELREIEPHASALRGIHSPQTGIVDYTEVCTVMADELRRCGVEITTGSEVRSIARVGGELEVRTAWSGVRARHLINCAGLYSDAVARMTGARPDVQIIPFRGEYYFIKPEKHDLVRGLIYPVPDPEFPFLGVHLTRTVHGEVEAGPNAVLAFAKEGYRFGRVNPAELAGTLGYRGFWNMARRYWRMGSYAMYRSLRKAAFVRALQRLLPALGEDDVVPGGAGVRAQAVSPDGSLVDDFRIVATADAIHVLNAPSPAATASIAIGRHIAGLAVDTFGI
jgi:(S)-2-hydroxyglutarate dehydrogenase